MILNSLQNCPLVWLTVEEDGTARIKKYEELFVAEKLQADYDLKAINIVLQGLSPNVYAIGNHHKVAKEIWDRVKLLMQGTKLSLQEKECLVVHVFNQGDDPISCLNKAMDFLTAIASFRFPSTNNQLRTSSNLRNQATIQDDRVTMQQVQERQDKVMLVIAIRVMLLVHGEIMQEGRQKWLNVIIIKVKVTCLDILDGKAAQTTIPNTIAFQAKNLDAYDSDYDDVSNTKAVLMANLFNYGLYAISEVTHFEPYHTDMDNLSVHAMQGFEQTPVVEFTDKEITKLPDEQAFWLQTSHPNTDQFASSPVKIKAPREHPKITPDAITEWE
uniref:Integrase, catalytic region, zinc finger, CCHC-type, peptidase aspartic, catalytic n=1 Tax=Tanacetum cinerariifolium TaxID=118510 RepID=A0A6L2JT76_TANCI|nr:hypothetical protein [Tanacetum cinerariifolium]